MSNYVRVEDFSVKDALTTGDPEKVITGADIDSEFDAIVTAIASKEDSANKGANSGYCGLDAGGLVDPTDLPTATTTAIGALETATAAEAQAETATDKIITPSNLADWSDANGGIIGDLQALTDPGGWRLLIWDGQWNVGAFGAAGNGLGLTDTSLRVDLNELTTEVSIAAGDFLAMVDITDSGSGKITFANLEAALNHDSLTGFVANEHIDHSSVSITAGNGLTGGGAINASSTIHVGAGALIDVQADQVDVDLTELAAFSGDDLVAADEFVIIDGGVQKKAAITSLNIPMQTAATQTLDTSDANTCLRNQSASTFTVTAPSDATAALPIGSFVLLSCTSTGRQTVAAGAGATVTSLNSKLSVKASGGLAVLLKINTNDWILSGDIEAT